MLNCSPLATAGADRTAAGLTAVAEEAVTAAVVTPVVGTDSVCDGMVCEDCEATTDEDFLAVAVMAADVAVV